MMMNKIYLLPICLALCVLLLPGCAFEAPAAPELFQDEAPPAGHIWYYINVPGARAARTLTQASDRSFMDYYEVFLKNTVDGTVKKGSAREGMPLRVAVVPGDTYDVLLLAGIYNYRVLLASAWSANNTIVEGAANNITLTLNYITADPATGWRFNKADTLTVGDSPARTNIVGSNLYAFPAGSVMAVNGISINTAGSGFAVGDIITYSGSSAAAPAKLRIANTGGAGIVTDIAVIERGSFPSSFTLSNAAVSGPDWGYSGSGSGLVITVPVEPRDLTPNTVTPWLTWEYPGAAPNTRTNPLIFDIQVSGLEPLNQAGGSLNSITFATNKLKLKVLRGSDTEFAPVEDPNPTQQTYAGGAITFRYEFPVAALPAVDSMGALYYNWDYYPFGDTSIGSKWSIRNGFLYGLDANTAGNGAVLVVIGQPGKYTPPSTEIEIIF